MKPGNDVQPVVPFDINTMLGLVKVWCGVFPVVSSDKDEEEGEGSGAEGVNVGWQEGGYVVVGDTGSWEIWRLLSVSEEP